MESPSPDHMDRFLAEFRLVLQKAYAAKADAENADEIRKITRSRLVNGFTGPATKAEHYAQCSTQYLEAAVRANTLRSLAAEANSEAEWYRARLDVWRTKAATRREQLKQTGGFDR